jgi:hypothetical protein
MGNRHIAALAWFLICGIVAADCAAVVINFDTDPGGNPVVAPTTFAATVPLTTLYSSIGVTFSGPTSLNGGAILSGGGFGVNPRSLPNFLAFNNTTTTPMQNGGLPRDPETIDFATPISSVSIFASGGGQATTFRMDAFDSGGGLITSTTGGNLGGQYVQLSIPSLATPASRVVLTQTGADNAFLYDDLEFTFIPEPAGLALAGALGMALLNRRR